MTFEMMQCVTQNDLKCHLNFSTVDAIGPKFGCTHKAHMYKRCNACHSNSLAVPDARAIERVD